MDWAWGFIRETMRNIIESLTSSQLCLGSLETNNGLARLISSVRVNSTRDTLEQVTVVPHPLGMWKLYQDVRSILALPSCSGVKNAVNLSGRQQVPMSVTSRQIHSFQPDQILARRYLVKCNGCLMSGVRTPKRSSENRWSSLPMDAVGRENTLMKFRFEPEVRRITTFQLGNNLIETT